jgi:hypothetical protein
LVPAPTKGARQEENGRDDANEKADGNEKADDDGPGGHADEPRNQGADREVEGQE